MRGWPVTPALSRMAPPRRGWPGSTPRPWARAPTARSASRCRRSPTPPPVRWTGGCSCPSAGTTPAPTMSRPRRRPGPGAPAGIGDDVRHWEKWRLAIDMLDELAGWGLTPPVVVADAGYGDAGEFGTGIAE